VSDTHTESGESGGTPELTQQDPEFIWDEYKYRHELCWTLVFRITAAVVIVSVIPYVEKDLARELDVWIVAPPAVGLFLAVLGLLRVRSELRLLETIRGKHRALHGAYYDISYDDCESTFERDMMTYLVLLAVLAFANILVIIFHWLPAINDPA
jgi:hypothetical protein